MTTPSASFLDLDDNLSAPAASQRQAPGRRAVLAGRLLGGFAALFLAFDAAMKLARVPMAVEGTTQLGYPAEVVLPIGVIQLVCLIIYVVPRTAPLGAILWTGYLGGAIATHVRVGNPLASHTLFPIYVAALLWGGLWLRDRRVRGLLAAR
ncbi:MAG: DoxX family protein [Myxococcales bacterium]|nr:DoxX family protein [Myxococcales bacterium]